MGKKGRKFINKGEGQHFYVLRRSQRDEANAGEEKPSDFVLVPSNRNNREEGKKRVFDAEDDIQDHVNALGFKNDGYDYSQHLREMGGGVYVGKDGSRQQLPASALVLPADVLPSENELERNLQAITISDEFMDEDIKDALFEDADEGDFEVMDDDFVSQAMAEPEHVENSEGGFDFDAHIRHLIEQR
jgi:protein LTV1